MAYRFRRRNSTFQHIPADRCGNDSYKRCEVCTELLHTFCRIIRNVVCGRSRTGPSNRTWLFICPWSALAFDRTRLLTARPLLTRESESSKPKSRGPRRTGTVRLGPRELSLETESAASMTKSAEVLGKSLHNAKRREPSLSAFCVNRNAIQFRGKGTSSPTHTLSEPGVYRARFLAGQEVTSTATAHFIPLDNAPGK